MTAPRLYPPIVPAPRASPAPVIPVTEAELAPWIQLLTTDQGADPLDPSSETTTGTGFDSGTGIFRIVHPTGLVTVRDGYRENCPRWSQNLLDLYDDFDPLTDILDLCMVVTQFQFSATIEKFGLWFGLFSTDASSFAAVNGQAWCMKPNTATRCNHGPFAETSDAAGNLLVADGAPLKMFARFAAADGVADAGYGVFTYARVEGPTAGVWEATDDQSQQQMPLSTEPLTDWTIQMGALHDSTTGTAGADNRFTMWHRRIKTSGFTGLPT